MGDGPREVVFPGEKISFKRFAVMVWPDLDTHWKVKRAIRNNRLRLYKSPYSDRLFGFSPRYRLIGGEKVERYSEKADELHNPRPVLPNRFGHRETYKGQAVYHEIVYVKAGG